MGIKKQIIECVKNAGLEVGEDGWINRDKISSLDFVTLLIELECHFGIGFPEPLVSFEIIDSLDYLEDIISTLVKNCEDENKV